MSEYCAVCDVVCKNKRNYTLHLQSKRHVQRSNNIQPNTCNCGKRFSHRQSLYLHRKTCDVAQEHTNANLLSKNESTKNDKEIIEELKNDLIRQKKDFERQKEEDQKEREEMRNQINTLLENSGNQAANGSLDKRTNHINSHNTINNIETQNITININAFGEENLDYLTNEGYASCLKRVYASVPEILKKIHFDPAHPENHNIKITNKKQPYASVVGENKEWKIVDRKDAIEKLMNKGYDLLEDKYCVPECRNQLSVNAKHCFEKFQEDFTSGEKKEVRRNVYRDVDLMIINGISSPATGPTATTTANSSDRT